MTDLLAETRRIERRASERRSELRHELSFNAYGHVVTCRVNDRALLDTVRLSSGRFSQCDPVPGAKPIHLALFVDRALTNEAMPPDLPSRLAYRMAGRTITVAGQDWVRALVHVDEHRGIALVSPTIGEQPHFLSRYICDNLTLHLLMRTHVGPMGHLHASCLYRDGKALLLSGPHSAGKSTTAVRLMEHGYQILSDSTTFARLWRGGIELLGYPVGELRLRLDTVREFPRFRAGGKPALVRDETKLVYSLRDHMPERVAERSVWPERIVICRLTRSSDPTTRADPMSPEQLMDEVWPESVFVDDAEVNEPNRVAVSSLVAKASRYRLNLGADVDQLLEVVDDL